MASQRIRGGAPYASTGANSLVRMEVTKFPYYATYETANQPGWVQLYAPTANSDTVIIGDLDNNGTNGVPLFPGAALMFPNGLDLRFATLFFLGGVGDKVYCSIGVQL